MEITATELKLNLKKYLDASGEEDIVITKNGKAIARLIGIKGSQYDPEVLAEWNKQMMEIYKIAEAPAPAYAPGSSDMPEVIDPTGTDAWVLTRNGEPVANLSPTKKIKKKRKLGFISGPPASEETDAALFESEFSDEDYERWLNEKW